MDTLEIKKQLAMVYNSLNTIEVKGLSNIGNLAGCIQIIGEIVNNIRDEEISES